MTAYVVPDIFKFSPAYQNAQRVLDEHQAQLAQEEHCWQALHKRKMDGPSYQDRETNMAFVLAGEDVPNFEADYANQTERVYAYRDVVERDRKQLNAAKKAASLELANHLKPDHDKLQKQLFSQLQELFGTYSKLFAMKRGILNQGLALNGLFAIDVQDLLGVPTDPASDLNCILREAAKAGLCKKVSQ